MYREKLGGMAGDPLQILMPKGRGTIREGGLIHVDRYMYWDLEIELLQ